MKYCDNETRSAIVREEQNYISGSNISKNNSNSKLKVFHLNIQYLRGKIDCLNVLLQLENPHVVVLSEHGLSENELYSINFDNYDVISNFSRSKHKCSGGLVILKKPNVTVNIINMSNFVNEMIFEAAGFELVLNKNVELSIIGIYRPPHHDNVNSFFNIFYQLLSKIVLNNRKCIIVGDLNFNWLKESKELFRLKDLLNEFNLTQHVDSPTRVTSSTSTLIDYVLSNMEPEAIQVEVLGTGLSDHYAQLISLPFKHVTTKRQTLNNYSDCYNLFNDSCQANLNSLKYALSKENWYSLKEITEAEKKLEHFLSVFKYNFSVACPLKKRRQINRTKKPWLTVGIITSSKTMRELDFRRKTNQSITFITYYKTYRHIYRKVIKAAKASHLGNQLKASDNLARDAWKLIDIDRKKKQVPLISDMPSPEEFNNYFSNIGEHKHSLITEPEVRSCHDAISPNTLSLYPTDSREVYKIIMNLKNSNSAGYDGLSHKLIRHCASHICESLADVINASLSQGVFPQELKRTIIRPILKDGASNIPSNWRPIANVSTISKIYEHVFANRLLKFLYKYNIICNEQYGFVKGRNTTDAMIDFIDKAVAALDKKFKTIGVFLDLQKAFDCLDHGKLFNRLHRIGVRGVALDWIKSYLKGRIQRVKINDTKQSGDLVVKFGIPQGSVLGPILFILYINDITKTISNLQITVYADDVSLLFKSRSWSDLEIDSFLQLTTLYQYLNSNNLHVNPDKTSCLQFSKNNSFETNPFILMDGYELPFRSEIKYLGLVFDNGIKWTAHVNALCSKISTQLFLLRRFSAYRCTFLTKLIYTSLIESRLRYGIILWGSTSRTNFQRVFRLQKRAIRIMAGLNKRVSCRDYFKSFNILTLPMIYIYEMLLFYKFKSTEIAGINIHNYNTRQRGQHRQTSHRLEVASWLPQNMGPKLFNNLPDFIKNELSHKKFKFLLHKYLMERACYSISEYFD